MWLSSDLNPNMEDILVEIGKQKRNNRDERFQKKKNYDEQDHIVSFFWIFCKKPFVKHQLNNNNN